MIGADLAVLFVPFLDGSSNRVEAGTDLEVQLHILYIINHVTSGSVQLHTLIITNHVTIGSVQLHTLIIINHVTSGSVQLHTLIIINHEATGSVQLHTLIIINHVAIGSVQLHTLIIINHVVIGSVQLLNTNHHQSCGHQYIQHQTSTHLLCQVYTIQQPTSSVKCTPYNNPPPLSNAHHNGYQMASWHTGLNYTSV